MKIILACFIVAMSAVTASAQSRGIYGNSGGSFGGYGTGSNSNSHSNSGYVTNSGTYVRPHQSTNPNSTQYDNYSTRGNVNPYTGAVGTRSPRY